MSSRGRDRNWREAARLLKLAGLMLASAVVIPITMISLGLLLGPRGYEGVIVAPLSVLFAWSLILFFGLRRRASPKRIGRARPAELPGEVAGFLRHRRRVLPDVAKKPLDLLLDQLDALESSVAHLTPEHPLAGRLRRLLADDLTSLVDNYQRLPDHVRRLPLHGGPSPEEQLLLGLDTIGAELRRVHDDICREDLLSLATKQRYLELKYGGGAGGGKKKRGD